MQARTDSGRRIDWVILSGLLVSLAAVRSGWLQEADPYWQARAGVENLAGAPLSRPDSWSWAPVPGLFYQTTPGWNSVLGLGWLAGGFWGLFVVGFLAIGAYLAVVALVSRALGARPLPASLGLLPVFALAMAMLSPRGTMVAQALLLAGVGCGWWLTARLGLGSPLVGLAIVAAAGFGLSLLGNWVHASWTLFAPALALGWALLWLLGGIGWARTTVLAGGALLGAAGGIALGPYGFSAFNRLDAVRQACEGLIAEWTSMLVPGLALRWVPAALLGVLIAVAALWLAFVWRARLTSDPALRLVAVLALLGGPLAAGGVIAVRLIGVGLLLLAPVAAYEATLLADWIRSRIARRSSPASARLEDWTSGRFWRIVLASVLIVLSPGTVLLAARHAEPADLAAVLALPSGCRLYALDGVAGSGSVAALVRPDVKVWSDGRADYYGRERVSEALRRITDPDLSDPVPTGATCVLVADNYDWLSFAPIVAALDADSSWRRLGRWGRTNVWVPAARA